ncbi:MAG TPA: tRNA (adenosine(37)-N6)-threonylcarbamoyltransferase complex ATPase subunit type 1 TsaE [Verrucomicrobiae bacterium]|nr:tRNA (adenosine(37)-N6)-threonylcarbamoyltransferase complex ATPase subunit type 1 TsaE [Verrucomicrobiae bacterium]
MKFQSNSEEETKAWAKQLVQAYFSNLSDTALVFTLQGEMGAGKTQFAKGVAEALEIKGIVSSPTYVLTREYQGELGKLVHIDCWRTPTITPEELHLDEYLQPETVTVIEWPAPLVPYLASRTDITLVMLEMGINGGVREITHL